MKFIKNNWQYIILIFLFVSLAWFFPLTGNDWFWGCSNNFSNPLNLWLKSNGNMFFSTMVFTLTNVKILKVLIYAAVTIGIFYMIKNIVNKKNNTVLFISLFLFLLLDLDIWKTVYVSTTNFSMFLVGTLLLILLIYLIISKKFESTSIWLFLILGILGSLIHPIFTLMFFIISLFLLIKKIIKGKTNNSYLLLFLGASVGVVSNLLGVYFNNVQINFNHVTSNMLNNVIPSILNHNFIIVLITIAFLLFLSIKTFCKSETLRKVKVALSMVSLSVYAFVILFSNNSILNYIAFLIYLISSLYLLININNSRLFKSKIVLYFVFKILYIGLSSLFIINNISFVLFPFIIDVIIIMELINYVFPQNFLSLVWYIAVCLFAIVNIYVYANVYIKYNDMNEYIIREIEKKENIIYIPSKYETDYLYNYLPNEQNVKYYLNFQGVENDEYTFKFD